MVLHTRVDRESSERKETDVGSWWGGKKKMQKAALF